MKIDITKLPNYKDIDLQILLFDLSATLLGTRLSDREREVLSHFTVLFQEGESIKANKKEIARKMGITVSTLNSYMTHLKQKKILFKHDNDTIINPLFTLFKNRGGMTLNITLRHGQRNEGYTEKSR